MNKKVMILGAGPGQRYIAQACKEHHHTLVVFAPERANSPCFEIADVVRYGDVRDKEAVLKAAREEGVDAIFSDQLDLAVPACGYAAEQLGLIGNTYQCALRFSDKKLMNEGVKALGICVAETVNVSTIEEAITAAQKVGYPLMLKPLDCDGSRGVFKVASEKELVENFEVSRQYSSDKTAVVQEFIEGDEYVVDGFAWDGKYKTLAIGRCHNFAIADKCISGQRIFKSAASPLTELEKQIIAANEKIAVGFGLSLAATQAEYIYNHKKDKIYFNEIAARGGGCYVSSHLVPYACGVDVNDLLMRYVAGEKIEDIELHGGYSAYTCFLLPEGEIVSIEGAEFLKTVPSLKLAFLSDINVGNNVPPIKDKSSRFGPFINSSADRDELLGDIENIKKNYKITICNPQGIPHDMIW